MLHDFASFCCQQSTANDDLPCDVPVVVQRYSWHFDCVYLLRMSPLLRSFSTMDLRVSWIGQLDFELSAMLVYSRPNCETVHAWNRHDVRPARAVRTAIFSLR